VFNATFNNISVISWWSVLLVEKTSNVVRLERVGLQYPKSFCAKDFCIKKLEGFVNKNWSYRTETIVSADGWQHNHNTTESINLQKTPFRNPWLAKMHKNWTTHVDLLQNGHHHLIECNFWSSRYSLNTAKVGVKHQSIYLITDYMKLILIVFKKIHTGTVNGNNCFTLDIVILPLTVWNFYWYSV
jgi:hypothetical protein